MKLSNLIFATLVLGVLTVPGAMTLYSIYKNGESAVSESERRNLETFGGALKRLNAGDLKAAEIGPTFGDAFKDQLAWRIDVTQIVNRILVTGFAHSTSDNVVVGPGGYWFQSGGRDFDMIPCALDSERLDAESLELFETISSFRERQLRAGVAVFLVLVPTADSVWPENLPEPLRSKCLRGGNPSQANLEAFKGNKDFIFYDLEWFKSYEKPNLFEGRNFHWFRPGATAYQNFIFSKPPISETMDVLPLGDIGQTREEIDLASDLGLGNIEAEIEFTRYIGNPTYLSLPRDDEALKAKLLPLMRGNRGGSVLVGRDGPGEQMGLLLGDSFTGQSWTYFSRNFNRSMRFNLNAVKNEVGVVDEIVEATGADFILIVFADDKFAVTQTSRSAYLRMFSPK